MKFEGSDIVRSPESKIEARGSLELIHFVLKYMRIEENHKGEGELYIWVLFAGARSFGFCRWFRLDLMVVVGGAHGCFLVACCWFRAAGCWSFKLVHWSGVSPQNCRSCRIKTPAKQQ
uniref:Uncharacterized protein n=1 Tax=Solanum tuberosum TaxID=4113 RepID=M1BM38_SOLTU